MTRVPHTLRLSTRTLRVIIGGSNCSSDGAWEPWARILSSYGVHCQSFIFSAKADCWHRYLGYLLALKVPRMPTIYRRTFGVTKEVVIVNIVNQLQNDGDKTNFKPELSIAADIYERCFSNPYTKISWCMVSYDRFIRFCVMFSWDLSPISKTRIIIPTCE